MDVKGLLIDLDGVLYVGEKAIPGAREALEYLRKKKLRFRFVSNTTRKCRGTIAGRLSAMGFDIPEEYIFTPPLAAVRSMQEAKKSRCYLLVTGDVDRDFAPVAGNDLPASVDYVIIGDAGENLTYDSLNRAFRYLMDGAELIALEKDRYWMAPDGLSLSAGPFVAALEFATGKAAVVMGKPSPAFFDLALRDMGLSPGEVVMVGDDVLTDIGGAYTAGMAGILVRTGKFREEALHLAPVKPLRVIGSIADLPGIL
jgi:HAD superfamily hydrolase (TIGR01458 family)